MLGLRCVFVKIKKNQHIFLRQEIQKLLAEE